MNSQPNARSFPGNEPIEYISGWIPIDIRSSNPTKTLFTLVYFR